MDLFDKAKDLLAEHGDKIEKGVDKAAELAKERAEQHSDSIDKAASAAKSMLGKLDGGKD